MNTRFHLIYLFVILGIAGCSNPSVNYTPTKTDGKSFTLTDLNTKAYQISGDQKFVKYAIWRTLQPNPEDN